jgi:hypothetical protein
MLLISNTLRRVPASFLVRNNVLLNKANFTSGDVKQKTEGGLQSWLPSWVASRFPGDHFGPQLSVEILIIDRPQLH